MALILTMQNDLVTSVREEGSEYREMLALNDAIKLLDQKKSDVCKEALPIFVKVNNAHSYLCKQLKMYLSE